MNCWVCPRGPETGHTLFRINAKGVPAVWACEIHRPPGFTVSPEVRFIEAALDPDEPEECERMNPMETAPRDREIECYGGDVIGWYRTKFEPHYRPCKQWPDRSDKADPEIVWFIVPDGWRELTI